MKIKTSTIIWLVLGFIWSWFMGITAVSMGFGSLFPDMNRIAKPFVCPGGQMVNSSELYQVSPVEEVTTLTWYCVDAQSGAKTELDPFVINFYAGSFYGLLIVVALLIIVYFYRRWNSSKKTEEVQKRAGWIVSIGITAFVIGITLIILMPLFSDLAPESTTAPDATATSIARTMETLTLGKISDFDSTDKPLAEWNGIPITPEATAGQQASDGTYRFRVPQTMDTIESYYSIKLKSLGWTLADSRWAGQEFTKGQSVLLVTLAPASDMEAFIVTLVLAQ